MQIFISFLNFSGKLIKSFFLRVAEKVQSAVGDWGSSAVPRILIPQCNVTLK
jgi:hypothetical protein